MNTYASNFSEISKTYSWNEPLREMACMLVKTEPIHSKALGENERVNIFREILIKFIEGKISFHEAIRSVKNSLPAHFINSNIFSRKWAERLVRTEFSRFYNQALLKILVSKGEQYCSVPHSANESDSSECTLSIAGHQWKTSEMLSSLTRAFSEGDWSRTKRLIPNHPNCNHVIKPVNNINF